MIHSAGISPSFAASSAAGKERTQSALTQHEMYIRRKAVRILQGAYWNNIELLWIIANLAQLICYNNRVIKLVDQSDPATPGYSATISSSCCCCSHPGLLCRNSAQVRCKLHIESQYDTDMINLPWRSLEEQAAPAKPPRIGSKPF